MKHLLRTLLALCTLALAAACSETLTPQPSAPARDSVPTFCSVPTSGTADLTCD